MQTHETAAFHNIDDDNTTPAGLKKAILKTMPIQNFFGQLWLNKNKFLEI